MVTILVIGFVGTVLAGLVMSFVVRQQPRRRIIRVVTSILVVPILLLLTLLIVLKFTLLKEPPTLVELAQEFSSKRADLETILRMSDEDMRFSRIAPTFVDRARDRPNGFGRYMANDPKAGLPKTRWDEYRKIYHRNGIALAIQRDQARDAFIMVDSVGLLNRGHTTGYLYCASNVSTEANRFYPCLLRQGNGKQEFDPESRKEGYSFQRVDARWFAYDEGPS